MPEDSRQQKELDVLSTQGELADSMGLCGKSRQCACCVDRDLELIILQWLGQIQCSD